MTTTDKINASLRTEREQAAKAAAKERRIYDNFFNRAAPRSR